MTNFIHFFDQHAGTILIFGPIIILLIVALRDITQTQHTIKRNYPVVGVLRYLLELIGPELRQYLFHDERSDRPIPRYLRTWVYANSKRQLATVAFGTKKDMDKPGTMLMRHSHFPINSTEKELDIDHKVTIGSKRRFPYNASLFNISAMSYGALGKNAVQALNNGAKVADCFHNTGEGGVSKYHLDSGADICVQVGTAKFGMRHANGDFDENKFLELAHMDQVKMFEIKLSQGAKPGKGGVLPKEKITDEIAAARGIEKGKDVISPPRHKEWEDEEGMIRWIDDLQNKSGKPIGIKFCLGRKGFMRRLIEAIKKTNMMPDFITVDGAEGATGAAPQAHTDYLGYPLKDALMFIDNALREAGLRDEIKLIASGKVITGADLAIMIALGADLCQGARGFMLSIGCIHALKCNTNHCPAGIATHRPWLERGLVIKEKIPRVANYHHAVIHEFNSMMHACGKTHPSEFKRSDIMKVVDFHKIVTMDELIPQPPLKACQGETN
ncbi:MAG: FMN-binding glutamate synthase family protein [Candidatus Melainabacteria bacterium]|jgi:glutamate synthase domain-containing protein 2|nr:FMN-binding glutamate synthase family protein [Candidatus Melainabacteria bacterium]